MDKQAKMVSAQLLGYAAVSDKPILLVLSSLSVKILRSSLYPSG